MQRFCSIRIFLAAVFLAALWLCTACAPDVSVQATGADGVTISFTTGFSQTVERTFKSLMSALSADSDPDAPLFSAADISALLHTIGAQNVRSLAKGTDVGGSGAIPALSQNALAAAGILQRTAQSLTLTLGAAQFQQLYAMLDEESQAYFDVLMIPALTDEAMTASAYHDVLASVYGKTFADEMTNGVLSVTLVAPDGKKRTTAQATLGELLTLTGEKSWAISW